MGRRRTDPVAARIRRSRKELAKVSRQLKSDFIGIDPVIDSIVDKMQAWHAMPEVLTRPTVICLWGLTGVGKTDAVRKIAKYLGMSDRYVEILMRTQTNSFRDTIRSYLWGSDIVPGEPGILLLDEIQNFRTLDENMREIPKCDFDDVWTLLSDGQFSGRYGLRSQLDEAVQMLLMELDQEAWKLEQTKRKKKKKAEKISKGDDDEVMLSSDDEEEETPFSCSFWEAQRLYDMIRPNVPLHEFRRMSIEERLELVDRKMRDQTTYEGENYSKLLVFVSGNLDEAFQDAIRGVADADRDADIVRTATMKVDLVHIKDALKCRFKPEQIARFGNNHIIYPSLDKRSFKLLIERRFDDAAAMVRAESRVQVAFDKHVHKLAYDNGVFPAQGTRPVLTSVDGIISAIVPAAVSDARLAGSRKVLVSYDEENLRLVAYYTRGMTKVRYEGTLDSIRRKMAKNQDRTAMIAAHEAGHVVAYCVLTGKAPQQITCRTTWKGGFVNGNAGEGSHRRSLDHACIALSGLAAEKIIFGEWASDGASSDITSATNCLGHLVRKEGHGRVPMHVMSAAQQCDSTLVSDMESTDREIMELLDNQFKRSEAIVREHSCFCADVAERLRVSGSLSSEEISAIADAYGVQADVVGSDFTFVGPYSKMLSQFLKSQGVESDGESAVVVEGDAIREIADEPEEIAAHSPKKKRKRRKDG